MTKPKRKGDWVGRRVKTRVEMRNGIFHIPAGAVMVVTANYGGLRLRSEACSCCGVSVYISKVPESEVELLPVEVVPEAASGQAET